MPAIRSLRPLRAAGLILALAAPVVATTALPAAASGESASAVLTAPTTGSASTFTWDYTFNQNGGHGLSNLAVGFCSADILADVVSASPSATVYNSGDVGGGHDGFGPGIKFAVTDPTGSFTVTFGHSHTISAQGLSLQSHSGDGQTGDATTHAAGPGPCSSDDGSSTTSSSSSSSSSSTSSSSSSSSTSSSSTSSSTSSTTSSTVPTGGENDGSTTTTTTTTTTGGTNDPTTTTTTIAPSVQETTTPPTDPPTVLGVTVEKTSDPAPTVTLVTTSDPAPAVTVATTSDPAPAVAGEAELAHTGSGHAPFMLRLAFGLLIAGLLLLFAPRRRRNLSADSAG